MHSVSPVHTVQLFCHLQCIIKVLTLSESFTLCFFRYKTRKTEPSWRHWISGKDEKEGGEKIRIGKKAAEKSPAKKPPGMPIHLLSSLIVPIRYTGTCNNLQ